MKYKNMGSKKTVLSNDDGLTDAGKKLIGAQFVEHHYLEWPDKMLAALEEFCGLVIGSNSKKEVMKVCRSDKRLQEFYLWVYENKTGFKQQGK
jgi:hypothetical protein